MTTHSSILAWRNPWTEEPGGLQSMGSQRVRHNLTAKQQLLRVKWKFLPYNSLLVLISSWDGEELILCLTNPKTFERMKTTIYCTSSICQTLRLQFLIWTYRISKGKCSRCNFTGNRAVASISCKVSELQSKGAKFGLGLSVFHIHDYSRPPRHQRINTSALSVAHTAGLPEHFAILKVPW